MLHSMVPSLHLSPIFLFIEQALDVCVHEECGGYLIFSTFIMLPPWFNYASVIVDVDIQNKSIPAVWEMWGRPAVWLYVRRYAPHACTQTRTNTHFHGRKYALASTRAQNINTYSDSKIITYTYSRHTHRNPHTDVWTQWLTITHLLSTHSTHCTLHKEDTLL